MAQRIPQEVIETVRSQTNIVEVIGQYVQLKKSGKNYLGLCPFHEERTPSFFCSICHKRRPPLSSYLACFNCFVKLMISIVNSSSSCLFPVRLASCCICFFNVISSAKPDLLITSSKSWISRGELSSATGKYSISTTNRLKFSSCKKSLKTLQG